MIYIITGQPGSGKTTLAKIIITNSEKDFIHLDGDIIRKIINNEDYSSTGRKQHVKNIFDMARILHHQHKNVIISMVSPFRELREDLKNDTAAIEFFTTSNRSIRKEYHVDYYEQPLNNFIKVDTDLLSIEEELQLLRERIHLN